MRPLGPVSRIEAVLLGSVLAFLLAVSVWFVVLRFSLGWPLNAVFAVAIAGVVGVRALRPGAGSERTPGNSGLLSFAIIIVAAAWVISTYWAGVALPGHDPITVPTIADRMAAGVLPTEIYKRGDHAYAYPPGYPIAFIPVVSMLDKVTALTAFKTLSLLTAALIPASWAWLLTRLFPISTPVWISLLLSYAIFFGLERMVVFGAAGKNTTYLMLLLAPPTILIMLRTSERWRDAAIGMLALFGLVLIHYSALHLVVCVLAGCAVVDLVRRNPDIRCMIILAVMGIGATIMLLAFYGEALADPRTAGLQQAHIPNALRSMLQAVTAESSPLLVIFHGVDVLGLARSPYRGALLLASAGIAFVVWRLLRTRDAANVAAGASAFLVAALCALAMATKLVPARIEPDYVSWFLWTIQGVVMLSGGLAILILITAMRTRRLLAGACALVALAALGFTAVKDSIQFRRANAWLAIHRPELLQLRTLLLRASDPRRPCFLIGRSQPEIFQVNFAHQSFILGYAEYLTPCTFANGGWMRVPVRDGRALDGYPSIAALNDLLQEGSVLFVGDVDAQNAYASRLGSDFGWSSAGDFSGHRLWRIERRS
jgi:hypothetical protein